MMPAAVQSVKCEVRSGDFLTSKTSCFDTSRHECLGMESGVSWSLGLAAPLADLPSALGSDDSDGDDAVPVFLTSAAPLAAQSGGFPQGAGPTAVFQYL